MTISEIANIIASIGLQYAYHHFPREQAQTLEPPYIVYSFYGADDLYADNINFQRIPELRIDLYSDQKEFEIEDRIEQCFADNQMTYDKTDTYLESELLYCTSYSMDIVLTKED